MNRSYEEINQRVSKGEAVVFTAEEAVAMAKESGPAEVLKKVDVVTTGTFGAMCSSGVFINFGHPEPPIRMERIELDGVSLCAGVAAVDAYIGATEVSHDDARRGGAHLIEALARGQSLRLRAWGKGTDCYPRREIESWISKDSVNEITMVNPRNAYQNYPAATNSTERHLYTYMGNLLPRQRNCNYSTSGELSPLLKDPGLRTVGPGTKVFLAGATGMVAWRGTQYNTERDTGATGLPLLNARTLMVVGDLKEMSPEYLRAAYFENYGVSLYVGLGLAFPVLDLDMAVDLSRGNAEIETTVLDYGLDGHPALARVNYAQLRSGWIELGGKRVKTAPLSSLAKARAIAQELKLRVKNGAFSLSPPVMAMPSRAKPQALIIREGGEGR